MKNKVTLLILLLATILRLYKLGEVPASLNWDESSNAYNAYSILKTGKDEYGKFLPLYNRSFDDYKPPLYMYLNVSTIAIFDLTPFASRLPSAFFGVLTILSIYFFTKRIFQSVKVALLSMFLLCLAPWHIQFSRVGFEANLGLFLAVLSFTLLLYAIDINQKPAKKNYLRLILSALSFGFSFYSYHSARIFIPVLFAAFVLIYLKEILLFSKKALTVFVLIVLVMIVPFVILAPRQAISGRFETTSLTTTVENLDESVKLMNQDPEYIGTFSKFIHNRRILIARSYLANYLSHFDLNYLFTTGDDNLRHHVQGMGVLFLYQLPLILLSIYLILQRRTNGAIFIVLWLLFSPLPAIPTNAVPHAVRSFTMVVPLIILTALAIVEIQRMIKQKIVLKLLVMAMISLTLLTYIHNYYSHYPREHSDIWQYGYMQAAMESDKLKNSYEKIIVDSSIEQGYIFFLFNTKFDPGSYQQSGNSEHFDKYFFSLEKPFKSNVLYVSEPSKFPKEFEILKTIYYPNNKEAIKIGHPK